MKFLLMLIILFISMHKLPEEGQKAVRKAVAAGKHIYCEKPIAVDTKQAMELYQLCKNAGRKTWCRAG